jgi:hypothetical protein
MANETSILEAGIDFSSPRNQFHGGIHSSGGIIAYTVKKG